MKRRVVAFGGVKGWGVREPDRPADRADALGTAHARAQARVGLEAAACRFGPGSHGRFVPASSRRGAAAARPEPTNATQGAGRKALA